MRRIVAALLVVWEPLTFAIAASSAIDWLMQRGLMAVVFLIARLLVTGIGISAGMRLWQEQPGGIALARWAYAGQLAAAIVAHSTRLWPTTLAPGIAEPAFAVGVAWYAGWLVWTVFAKDRLRQA
jgi:hypothetical protein